MLLSPTIAVLGLDGATWDVIDPLLAQGKLPNLARLMERGAYGRIATLPGYTSPALWATILTGKLPSKHGVRDFYTATGRHLQVKPIYEILEQDPVGLFQMYAASWSPDRSGFLVPSRIEDPRAAYPSELAFVTDFNAENHVALIGKLLRYGVPPWVAAKAVPMLFSRYCGVQDAKAWQLKMDMLGQQFRGHIAAHLVKKGKPAFFASLFYLLDHLGHYYWCYWEPSRWANFQQAQIRRVGQVLPKAYADVDRQIGRILHALPSSSLVVVVSDHGMETASSEMGGKPVTLKGKSVLAALEMTGEFVTELVPPFESVFRARLPAWTPDATDQLIHQVSQATLPDGTHPFQVHCPDVRSAIVRLSSSLMMHLDEIVAFPSGLTAPLSRFVFQHQEINGTHARHGILVLAGDGIRRGVRLQDRELADVTPTLLALSGRAVARDMDGRVIEDALQKKFLALRPVRFIDSYETDASSHDPALLDDGEQEVVENRLRAMGYLA